MMNCFETTVDFAALAWLEAIGWRTANGPDIAPDFTAVQRRDNRERALLQRIRCALTRLDPQLSLRRWTRPTTSVPGRRTGRRCRLGDLHSSIR